MPEIETLSRFNRPWMSTPDPERLQLLKKKKKVVCDDCGNECDIEDTTLYRLELILCSNCYYSLFEFDEL